MKTSNVDANMRKDLAPAKLNGRIDHIADQVISQARSQIKIRMAYRKKWRGSTTQDSKRRRTAVTPSRIGDVAVE